MRRAVLLLALMLAGCGYRVAGLAPTPAVGPVMLHTFENRTLFPSLEALLADSVSREFSRRGVVLETDGAFSLEGRAEAYSSEPASHTPDDRVSEYRATVAATFAYRAKGSGQALWKGKISRSRVYPALQDVQLRRNAEEAAVREICREIAADLYISVSQRF